MTEDMSGDENIERFAAALGLAAIDLWSELPQEVQQNLFEQAVVRGHKTERDESLREQLAQFLHDHHERTAIRTAGQAGSV
jgi:glucose-6-phosphate-specific signal transduction histidine kinase